MPRPSVWHACPFRLSSIRAADLPFGSATTDGHVTLAPVTVAEVESHDVLLVRRSARWRCRGVDGRAETRSRPARARGRRASVLTPRLRSTQRHRDPWRPIVASFNLSAWAVRHRALVLFMILAVAVGGTLSFLRLGRARRPQLHDQGRGGHGRLAGRNRARDAGSGHGPDREEISGVALLRQGHDLRETRLRGSPGRVPGQHAAVSRPEPVLSSAQEAR